MSLNCFLTKYFKNLKHTKVSIIKCKMIGFKTEEFVTDLFKLFFFRGPQWGQCSLGLGLLHYQIKLTFIVCHYHHTFSDSKMTWRCPLSGKQKLVQVAAHCYCWFAGQHSEHYKDTKQKYFCVLVVFSSEQTGSLLVFADGAVIFSRLFPLLSVFTPEAGDHSGVCSCCDL